MPRRPVKRPALPEQLVTHPAQLAACLAHLAESPLVGFDTEFVGEDAYRPELCLIQVATAEALYDVGPGEIPGKPGTIIRIWPLEGGGPGMGGMGDFGGMDMGDDF